MESKPTPATNPKVENKESKPEPKKEEDEIIINPNKFVNNSNKDIDYQKIVTQFGLKTIDDKLMTRIETLTKIPPHHFLTRGIFFAHR